MQFIELIGFFLQFLIDFYSCTTKMLHIRPCELVLKGVKKVLLRTTFYFQ